MQRAKPEPEPTNCACGRDRSAAQTTVYRSPQGRYIFHRCDCGMEWTERLAAYDPTQPVSSDELLEVHERLLRFEGSLAELIGISQAS